jgi:hypothetical protein
VTIAVASVAASLATRSGLGETADSDVSDPSTAG